MQTANQENDNKKANVEKYLHSEERKKYVTHPSKIYKTKNFRRRCKYLVGKGDKILDIGGGAGIWTDIIREAGITDDIYAVDISESILKERNSKDISKVGDMEHIPFPDKYFDRALFIASLHHVGNTQRALSEAIRVVKPHGYIVFYEPVSLRLLLLGRGIEPTADKVEFCFSISYVLKNLKKSSLKIVFIEYEGFLTRFLGRKAGVKTLLFFSRIEMWIGKIPLISKLFGIFANAVTIVAQKD
jgi:ubiquinone/menaquinone biosynthesis C-methylase UbiE